MSRRDAQGMECCAALTRTLDFILASASPRRGALLRKLLKEFSVLPANIDENVVPFESPVSYVLRVSRAKADTACEGVGKRGQAAWILGADTIVVLGDRILGKPASREEARGMLGGLQGRDHEVITGICLLHRGEGVLEQHAVHSRVWMRRVCPEEIEAYVDSGEPFDKAGGYAIQGLAGRFVARVEGSFTNVVGLPLEHLEERFRVLGILSRPGDSPPEEHS